MLVRARHDASTSSLLNHVKKCVPGKKGPIEKFIPGANYSKALFRFKLMVWIVRRHRPYTILEDKELLDLFCMLFESVEVPSARTISRDVIEVFEMSKINIINLLKVHRLRTREVRTY